MKKQLEKEDKKQDAPGSSKEKSENQFCSAPSKSEFIFSNISILHSTIYSANYPDSPSLSIFHPPAIC